VSGARPYCAAVGPNRTGVLLSSGPHAVGWRWLTVRVFDRASTATTARPACEYAVLRALAWVRNGAAASSASVW
jgi:hypothetical protein